MSSPLSLGMPGGSWMLEEEEEDLAGFSAPQGFINKLAENSPSSTQESYKSEIVTLDAAKLSEEIVLLASPSSTSRATIRVRVSPDSDIEEVLPPDHEQNGREAVTRVFRISPQQRRARCLDIFPEIKLRASPSSTDSPLVAPMVDLGWDFPRGGSPSGSQDGSFPNDAEEIRPSSQDDCGLGLTFLSSSSVNDQSCGKIDTAARDSLAPSEPRQEAHKADRLSSSVDDRSSGVESPAGDSPHLSRSEPPREESKADGGPGTSSSVDHRRLDAGESAAGDSPHLSPSESPQEEFRGDGRLGTFSSVDDGRSDAIESSAEDSPHFEPLRAESKADEGSGPASPSSVDGRSYETIDSIAAASRHLSPSEPPGEESRGDGGPGTSSSVDRRFDAIESSAEDSPRLSPSEPPREESRPGTSSSVDDRRYEAIESPGGAAHPSESPREEPRGVDGLGTSTPPTHANTEPEGNSPSTAPPEPEEFNLDDGLVISTPPCPIPFVSDASDDGIHSTLSTPCPEESGPDDELSTTPTSSVDYPSESTSRNSPLVLPSDSSLEDGLSTTHSSPSVAVTSISLPSTARPSVAPSRSTVRAEVASPSSDSPNSRSPPLDDAIDDLIPLTSPFDRTVAVAALTGHDADSESMHSLCLHPATASVLSGDDVALQNGPGPEVDDQPLELEYLDEYPLPPMTPLSFIDVDQLSLSLSLDSSFGLPADFGWEIVQHPSPEHDNDDAGDLVAETGGLFVQHPNHDDTAGDLVAETKVKPLQLHFAEPSVCEPVLEAPYAPAAEIAPDSEDAVRNQRDDASYGPALLAPLNGESEDEWLLPPLHFASPSLTDEVLSSPEFRATTILDSFQDADTSNSAAPTRARIAPASRTRHTRAFSTSNINPSAVIERRSTIVWAPHDTRYAPDGTRTSTLTANAKGKARAGPRPRARTVSADSGFAEGSRSARGERVEPDDPGEAERLVSRPQKLRVKRDKVAGLQRQRDKSQERWEMRVVAKMCSWGFSPPYYSSSLEDAVL